MHRLKENIFTILKNTMAKLKIVLSLVYPLLQVVVSYCNGVVATVVTCNQMLFQLRSYGEMQTKVGEIPSQKGSRNFVLD